MENNLRDFYVAVLKNGQTIRYTRLDMLKALDLRTVECFLKAVYCENEYEAYSGCWNKASFYHYFVISQTGDYKYYSNGYYKVAAIGPEYCGTREITFSNCAGTKEFSYTSTESPDRFIFYELKPMLYQMKDSKTDEEIKALCKS